MLKFSALLFAGLAALASAAEFRIASFNIGAFFDAGGSQYTLGNPGSVDFETVRSILDRIDADVVALQEIHDADSNDEPPGTPEDIDVLAQGLGYPHVYIPSFTNLDFTFRTVFLSRYPFISSTSISSPAGANEITRRFPKVKVNVPNTDNDPWIIAAHLKSGISLAERFQRTVEMRRLTNDLAASGLTVADNYIIVGDFNLSSIPATFAAPPSAMSLPPNYDLGADISFPIDYHTDPLSYFSYPPVVRPGLRQVDGSTATFGTAPGDTQSAIDLILVSPSIKNRPYFSEIYNSTLDTSNTVGLPKTGSPLAPDTSQLASDHYAIFADVNLENAGPYVFTAPGQTVVEDFTGFDGSYDPSPWVTSTPAHWRGIDNGTQPTPGFRSYGPSGNPSLGHLSDPIASATFAATFVNQSAETLTRLEISFTARQWRAYLSGLANNLTADLVTPAGTFSIPALAFASATNLPTGPVPSPSGSLLTATVENLAIRPGQSFQLRFTSSPSPGGSALPDDVFINEFHYDNDGADTGEFAEIAIAPGFTGKLSETKLYLYNGNGGVTYGVHALDSFTAGTITSSGHRLFSKLIPGLENGPDGLAVAHNTRLFQFISYEGAFNATNGPAATVGSFNLPVSQPATNSATTDSIRLMGTGSVGSGFTWTKSAVAHGPGAVNSGQTFTAPLQSQGISIDDVTVKFLLALDSDGDGFSDPVESFLLLTNPADPASTFIALFTQPSPSLNRLEFPTLIGRKYIIEQSPDLFIWTDGPVYSGNGSPRVVDFPILPGEPKYFRRIRVAFE